SRSMRRALSAKNKLLSLMDRCLFQIFMISTVRLGRDAIISFTRGSSILCQSKLLKLLEIG
ncbi:hypothetical protein A2U01_0089105, partial [Trifolium medium]|nr:hypothetical protein [Trifolium medium]